MKTRAALAPIRPLRCKPGRPLAIMAKLSSSQKETLFAWLTKNGGLTYEQARERVWRKWGVKTNMSQLSSFWQRYCQPRLMQPAPADPGGNVLLEIVIQVRKRGEP